MTREEGSIAVTLTSSSGPDLTLTQIYLGHEPAVYFKPVVEEVDGEELIFWELHACDLHTVAELADVFEFFADALREGTVSERVDE